MSQVVCCIVNEPHVIKLARASWYGTCFRNHKISSIIITFLVHCIVEWWITFLRRIYLNKVNLATKPTIMVALHYWKLPLLLEFHLPLPCWFCKSMSNTYACHMHSFLSTDSTKWSFSSPSCMTIVSVGIKHLSLRNITCFFHHSSLARATSSVAI